MKSNKIAGEAFLEVVDNQIRSNKPPESATTYTRLMNEGYSSLDAKRLIAQCIATEMFVMMKEGKPFNEGRFVRNLNNLHGEASEK